MSKIWIDADALPGLIKDVLFRAANKREVYITLVANRWLQEPPSDYIDAKVVSAGADEADDWIVENCDAGELVITADIPLAARVVERGATVITPRGRELTESNVAEALSLRDFGTELREMGIQTGGAAPFSPKDTQSFSNALDRWITKNIINKR